MEPTQKEKTPLELAQPEEKLLRPPTFFEKYAWIKPVSIIVILIATITLSTYLLQANTTAPDNISTKPSPTTISTNTGWKTYISIEGKYSLKYPADYTLTTLEDFPNTVNLSSTLLPGLNKNYGLIIQYKNISANQTLQQLIRQQLIISDSILNPVCFVDPTQKSTTSTINGQNPAELVTDDTTCGKYVSVIYTKNNNIFYVMTIVSEAKFSEIKQYTDQIFSTLKFLDAEEISPKISCRPRPACLDSNPSCMLDTPDMCPKTIPTQKQVACTQDAKQCPDGSWVGRTGPNCEFICPK